MVVHLHRDGTSLVLDLPGDSLPRVLHWGPDLGGNDGDQLALGARMPVTDSVMYAPSDVCVLPLHSGGWLGRPGLLGSRDGRDWSVGFETVVHEVVDDGPVASVTSTAADDVAGLVVGTQVQLHPGGLVRVRASVRNTGAPGYEVVAVEPALPVGQVATELLDLTGRHTRERTPQRHPFVQGQWVRQSWGGRPGHDSATVLMAGARGFGFRSGRVWGVHLAWSGNQQLVAEQTPTGWRLLRAGELLLPGEVRLGTGEEYVSPWLTGSWGDGLDELSARFHRFVRDLPGRVTSPRPVLVNTWEAVYFDQDLPHLLDLADRAAQVGAERFVLDDGWFSGRRDDTAGLGDWTVDPQVWPEGLGPLADRVHALGMQLGLWVEPEMVNLDSDLARAHPDWVMGTRRGPGLPSRHQHVLDLGVEEAYEHVRDAISRLVEAYGIVFLKWDHNRPLVDAGHGPDLVPGVHRQTRAVWRMMADLKARHPGLEIESCAGGGARVDLGVMEHVDRVWVSDSIDAHERHRSVRWTGLLLPPEVMGTHVGSGADHSTGRVHGLPFRAGTAVWGHLGIEQDLSAASAAELDELRTWVRWHRDNRDLLHTGTVVHADLSNPALQLDGVVGVDRARGLYRLSALDHTVTWPPGLVVLPGLDPVAVYDVRVVPLPVELVLPAPWMAAGVRLTGRALEEVGVQSPVLQPDHLVIIEATRTS